MKLKRFQDSSPSGLVTNLIGNANNIVREIKYLATNDLNYVPITSKYFSFQGMIYSKIYFLTFDYRCTVQTKFSRIQYLFNLSLVISFLHNQTNNKL